MVTFVDRGVGRVLQALKDVGHQDDTCVVWISDHGTHLNEHGAILSKRCQFNEVGRTVLKVRVPGAPSAGKHFKDLVQPPDLAPTLLDLAGVSIPARMQGESYAPLLNGQAFKAREVAITGGAQRVAYKARSLSITARDQRWVLVDSPDPEQRVLFDTDNDPRQLADVAGDHPGEVARLHDAVVDFVRTHDAQPQVVRMWETGKPGDMTGYVAIRPGCERYHTYFNHILNRGVLPED